MAVVDASLIAEQQPVTKAAQGLKTVLEENRSVISDGDQALKSVVIGAEGPRLQYPKAFILADRIDPLRAENIMGVIGVRMRFTITLAVKRISVNDTYESAYLFGDALGTVLRAQERLAGAWDDLEVGQVRHGNILAGNNVKYASVQVNVDVDRYMENR